MNIILCGYLGRKNPRNLLFKFNTEEHYFFSGFAYPLRMFAMNFVLSLCRGVTYFLYK